MNISQKKDPTRSLPRTSGKPRGCNSKSGTWVVRTTLSYGSRQKYEVIVVTFMREEAGEKAYIHMRYEKDTNLPITLQAKTVRYKTARKLKNPIMQTLFANNLVRLDV